MRQQQRAANLQRLRYPVSTIEMFIDELVLHGFAVADRYDIGDGLACELKQLFKYSQSSIFPTKNADIAVLNAGRTIVPSNVRPVSVGTQVAQAVYGSLINTKRGSQR